MDKIYDAYYEKLYNWSLLKTNNKEDAEDLTNSVFLAIFEYLNKNMKVDKLENLIWKIASHLWCTKAKGYIKEKETISFDETYQVGYENEMLDKLIYKEIVGSLCKIGLTEKEKASFELYYIHDLSIKEISKSLNTKEANIKFYLYSARNKKRRDMMNELNLDNYLNVVNEEKVRRGLDTYIPLYPMLRVEEETLYVAVMLTKEQDNVWSKEEKIVAEYWALVDIYQNQITAFHKTEDNPFFLGKLREKTNAQKQKELSKYTVEKTLQYKNYLLSDIQDGQLPIQKRAEAIIGETLEIDGQKVKINDYIMSHIEEELKVKIDELVDLLVQSKYGSILFYYDVLMQQVMNQYKTNKTIDREKVNLCTEIMNYYYDGVVGIDQFFHL